jgi:hypothetical protein
MTTFRKKKKEEVVCPKFQCSQCTLTKTTAQHTE